jgi:DNA-binding Lrp family transcriptional regulator
LIENPEITHEEIATRVSRSQPAVGARILKLKKKQLISLTVGVNFKTAGLVLGIITFSGAHATQLKAYLNTIPQFVHVFKTSGPTNFMILVPGTTMEEIEETVDIYLRPHPDIANIATNYLMESLKNLVLPYYLALEPTSVAVVDAKQTIETPLPTIETRQVPKKVPV